VTAVCLAATLWGGLGTNASGGAALRAERAKVSTTAQQDQAELARLTLERGKLPVFVPTTQEAVKAAQDAVASAERVRAADCETRRARCRDRETEEQARRTELATVLSNRAATVNAAKLDTAIADVRGRLYTSPAAVDVDPQASAFSQLTGVSVEQAIALNAFWLSMAFELGAMFTMLIAYSNPTDPRGSVQDHPSTADHSALGSHLPPATPVAPAKRPLMIAGTVMAEPPAAPVGDVKRFLLACLPRANGEQVALSAVYARYRRWCDEQMASPLSATAFGEEFKAICDRVALRTRQDGSKVYCLDVRLVA